MHRPHMLFQLVNTRKGLVTRSICMATTSLDLAVKGVELEMNGLVVAVQVGDSGEETIPAAARPEADVLALLAAGVGQDASG